MAGSQQGWCPSPIQGVRFRRQSHWVAARGPEVPDINSDLGLRTNSMFELI